jgi:hypothetical protein
VAGAVNAVFFDGNSGAKTGESPRYLRSFQDRCAMRQRWRFGPLRFEDLDGDGVPEFITGKRKYAHGTGGTGANEPAVLVYYKLRVDETAVNWDRYDIDPDQTSGVGTDFDVRDVNGDGLLDIIISNKNGLFYFEQIPQ